MRILDQELRYRKVEINKLLEYGFKIVNGRYVYECNLYSANFRVYVEFYENKMSAKVIDLDNNDEYLLADVFSSSGEFVGKIKEEYDSILEDIIEKCSVFDVFKEKQAKQVICYIKEKYNDDLEFLWKKYDNNAVWRNKKNNKWYGALLIVSESKIGLSSDKIVEIIDLRYQNDKIKNIIDNKDIFPGYHMNKNNWITIKLDGSVGIERIFELIDNSYNISLTK